MLGFQAALTRRDDRFVPLRGRVRMAHAAGAHLMLSLHTDTLESGEAEGASLYTLSREGTDDAADAFAERENRADILAGADLSGAEDDVTRLLIALARRGTEAESVKLAETLVDALRGTTRLLDTRPHRRGNFFVLKAPDLPSVLIELGFLSSPADRARLADPDWNARMADALAQGVADWAKLASPGFLAPRD
jgi:N-acetylmuramoyl-L-alanine amidase